MNLVTVREHARLTTGPVPAASLDVASVPASAFDWLCREAQRHRAGGASLAQIEDRRWLRLDNYVGVLESPCGTRIEILPKHVQGDTDITTARQVLVRMLRHGLHLPVRETGPTALHAFDAPVSEWIIHQFLVELDALVRRGLRFDYHPVEEELRFLRGRLRVAQQVRQPPGRQHVFQVEHQAFDADRPENRLLASALSKVAGMTKEPGNWRLAHELGHQMAEIPESRDFAGDFHRWSDDRLMGRYRVLRPWCQLILGDRDPTSALGEWTSRSLLFPTEKVFEAYVGACLRRVLPRGARLRTQAAGKYLCRQGERPMFQLRPDFLVEHEDSVWVLDAKWKLLDTTDVGNQYGLSQGDFYQLFAYGQRYRVRSGQLALIYPRCETFQAALEPFDMGQDSILNVCAIDLSTGVLDFAPIPGALSH